MHYFQGSREHRPPPPLAGVLIIKDFKCFNDKFTDSGYLSNNRRRLLKSGTALERRFPSVDGSVKGGGGGGGLPPRQFSNSRCL